MTKERQICGNTCKIWKWYPTGMTKKRQICGNTCKIWKWYPTGMTMKRQIYLKLDLSTTNDIRSVGNSPTTKWIKSYSDRLNIPPTTQPQSPTSTHAFLYFYVYRQTSKIKWAKSQNLNVSRLVLQLSLLIPLKPGVQSRMKMKLEQRRQAMLQLHLSDQQFYCLLVCDL